MLTLYVICAVVGLALAILAAVGAEFGHHELGDAHLDVGGHDVDGDGIVDEGIWVPFFSLRFWTYFLAGFGATGYLLHRFGGVSETVVPIIASVTGLIAGLTIALAVRMLRKNESDSMTSTKDVLGADATVLVAIRRGQPGRIRCEMKGELIDYLAVTDEEFALEPGSRVIVTSIENDRAHVIPRSALFDEGVTVGS